MQTQQKTTQTIPLDEEHDRCQLDNSIRENQTTHHPCELQQIEHPNDSIKIDQTGKPNKQHHHPHDPPPALPARGEGTQPHDHIGHHDPEKNKTKNEKTLSIDPDNLHH